MVSFSVGEISREVTGTHLNKTSTTQFIGRFFSFVQISVPILDFHEAQLLSFHVDVLSSQSLILYSAMSASARHKSTWLISEVKIIT